MEAVELFNFVPTMGMGRISSYRAQTSGCVGWWVGDMGRVGDALLELAW